MTEKGREGDGGGGRDCRPGFKIKERKLKKKKEEKN
jgi:hypothetical protein